MLLKKFISALRKFSVLCSVFTRFGYLDFSEREAFIFLVSYFYSSVSMLLPGQWCLNGVGLELNAFP